MGKGEAKDMIIGFDCAEYADTFTRMINRATAEITPAILRRNLGLISPIIVDVYCAII